MIDKVLGTQPVVRRKRPDTTSEASSQKDNTSPLVTSSPTKPVKRLYAEESAKGEEPGNPAGQTNVKAKGKPQKSESKAESQQQIASPAVRNLRMAKVPLNVQDMKNSTKLYLKESARAMQQQNAPKPEQDFAYKIKLIVFLIISLGLVIFAMSPSRKVRGRRK